MSGERDLEKLFAGLDVFQHKGVWEFVTGTQETVPGAVMSFREREGWTHIVEAHRSASAEQRFVWLELTVYSDLNAVGFMAGVAKALGEAGVPCNAVAVFHHDHVFVPESMAEKAVAALAALRT